MKLTSLRSRKTLNWCVAAGLAATCVGTVFAGGRSFTNGNLVVVRVGDGGAALGTTATAAFIEEYTTAGALVGTPLALPTAVAGSNKRMTVSGTATSEGFITRSANGQYLIVVGYDADPGTVSVATSVSATVNRVVGRITIGTNAIDSSTAVDMYNASNIRSACSDNGTRFWAAGNSTTTNGVRFIASLGGTTSDQLSTAPTNTRVVDIANDGSQNQLFVTTASGTFLGVNAVGSGLPTTSGQTITLLNGFPTAGTHSSYDYFFANPSTVYVADDGSAASGGGIQKWTLSGGTWSLAYNVITTGVRGLTGYTSGGSVILFATNTTASNNSLITVTDTGAGSTATPIASAGTNKAFRGVRYLPAPTMPTCVPDIAPPGGNGTVNVDDLLLVINSWGPCPQPCPPHCTADIAPPGGNCVVNVDDLLAVINGWGPCPP